MSGTHPSPPATEGKLVRPLPFEDGEEGAVVGCCVPLGGVEDAALLLLDEFAQFFADEYVIESGVDVLVVPVVGPDFAAGVLEGEGFEVSGGIIGALGGADGGGAAGVVEVAVAEDEGVGVFVEDGVEVLAEDVGLVAAHHFLVGFGDFAFGFEVDAEEADVLAAGLDGGVEDAAAHGEVPALEGVAEIFRGIA